MKKAPAMNEEKTQIEKFKKAVKDYACEESEDAFDAKLKQLATSPPPKDEKEKDKTPEK